MFNSKIPNPSDLPSTKKLLQSTGVALLIATAVLVFAVLPAEYGIDVTGIGKVLNLTKMGEIKVALAKEAAIGKENALEKTSEDIRAVAVTEEKSTPSALQQNPKTLGHEKTLVLKPGDKIEFKLEMKKGWTVEYEWSANGGRINYDTHGDPYGNPKGYYNYTKGKMAARDTGILTAAFDGYHGWFWRNRDNAPVTVTIKTKGEYLGVKEML